MRTDEQFHSELERGFQNSTWSLLCGERDSCCGELPRNIPSEYLETICEGIEFETGDWEVSNASPWLIERKCSNGGKFRMSDDHDISYTSDKLHIYLHANSNVEMVFVGEDEIQTVRYEDNPGYYVNMHYKTISRKDLFRSGRNLDLTEVLLRAFDKIYKYPELISTVELMGRGMEASREGMDDVPKEYIFHFINAAIKLEDCNKTEKFCSQYRNLGEEDTTNKRKEKSQDKHF